MSGKPKPGHDPVAELREAIREAHGLLGDLRRERKLLTEAATAYRHEFGREQLAPLLQTEVERAFSALESTLQEITRKASAGIYRRYDEMSALLMGTRGGEGRPALEDVAEAWLSRLSPEERTTLARKAQAVFRGTEIESLLNGSDGG